MANLFQIIFYQPILNLLVFLYNTVSFQDLGVAIVLLTIIIKVVLLPFSKQSIKAQKSMQDIQPKIDEVKKKYKDNKEEMGKALMNLYKENKVNPFSSCLPMLIQLPFLWAVFRVFRDDPGKHLDLVYSFLARFKPETIETISFGFLDLSKPNIVLALLAGLAQFWQAKHMMNRRKANKNIQAVSEVGGKEENMATIMNKQMLYFMPIITVVIGVSLPGGLTLYWFLTTLLTALQQIYVFKKNEPKASINNQEVIEAKP